jgi:cell division protein ZapA (FtsZ GTPase activity inhibitor)
MHKINNTENHRIIEISLSGAKYKFKAEEKVKNPKQVEEMILNELNDAFKNISKASVSSNSMPALILSGLSISQKYIEARKKYKNIINSMTEKLDSMEKNLDSAIEKTIYKDKKDIVIRTANKPENNYQIPEIQKEETKDLIQKEATIENKTSNKPSLEEKKSPEKADVKKHKPDVVT